MSLIYAGIDEAGYGPLLGPLTVAAAVFAVDRWRSGDAEPDLWEVLGAAVCRKPGDKPGVAQGLIAIGDSKKLKLPNDGARHPLTHLERGVLACLRCAAGAADGAGVGVIESDAALFEALLLPGVIKRCCARRDAASDADADVGPAWYGGGARPLPEATHPGELAIAAAQLRRAMAQQETAIVALKAEALDEASFNAIVRHAGTKAAAPGYAIVHLLRLIVERASSHRPDAAVRIVIDKQSGRNDYLSLLTTAWPGAGVRVIEQSAEGSRYAVDLVPGVDLRVLFRAEAESHALPVALASMTAKLVRELLMARFNRHWQAEAAGRGVAELKPTAGYTQDGRRWLHDLRRVLSDQERAALCRIA